jgi:hypothetical protein
MDIMDNSIRKCLCSRSLVALAQVLDAAASTAAVNMCGKPELGLGTVQNRRQFDRKNFEPCIDHQMLELVISEETQKSVCSLNNTGEPCLPRRDCDGL